MGEGCEVVSEAPGEAAAYALAKSTQRDIGTALGLRDRLTSHSDYRRSFKLTQAQVRTTRHAVLTSPSSR